MADHSAPFRSIDAATGEPFGDPLHVDGAAEVAAACAAAEAAFDPFRMAGSAVRARLLDDIAQEIVDLGDELVVTAMRESGLPRLRLEGERGRTVGQLRLFAEVVRRGDWERGRIDPALPERQPLPRPELRLRMIPLGPVAVFGASNFPLAFSTAGGDTASALAAGCPVVVKAHPAHPQTSLLVAGAVQRAVQSAGLPSGVFSHLQGPSHDLGECLVRDARIMAVGFTGSRAGGLALLRIAQARPVPVPVYAEMSSVNPVVLLPAALNARADAIGQGFAQSLTMGAGQFCTNPGLVIGIDGPALEAFCSAAASAIAQTASQVMLTRTILETYQRSVTTLQGRSDVVPIAEGPADTLAAKARTMLFRTTAESFLAQQSLQAEVFGPAAIVVSCRDADELFTVICNLEGQLTGTVHLEQDDRDVASVLIPMLERRVGRVLFNGWPTGVEVGEAMVHGGPFPATSDSRTTSVGSLAIERFLRPVCYQATPAWL